MKFEIKSPSEFFSYNLFNKAIDEAELNNFEKALNDFINEIEVAKQKRETEEHFKSLLKDFLVKQFYQNHYINTKSYTGNHEADLVIHQDDSSNSFVNVIFEIKRPENTSEMISSSDCVKKALCEAITYYLWEKINCNNIQIKHIVITNIEQWFIFDASSFHMLFFNNSSIVETFKQWKNRASDSNATSNFYRFLENHLRQDEASLPVLFFQLPTPNNLFAFNDSYKNKVIEFYKILSPQLLLKEAPKQEGSYTLNKDFYYELLYILGLEEVVESGKILIRRVAEKNRNDGALIENTISILKAEVDLEKIRQFSNEKDEKDIYFEAALELCLIWINRILFIKLLESQLVAMHNDDNYKILTKERITDFDQLNILFSHILNCKPEKRDKRHNEKFPNLPYLNSSLFEVSEVEEKLGKNIANLEDMILMPVFSRTVLRDEQGNSLKGKKIDALQYLLQFLNAFHFGGQNIEGVLIDTDKLINSAVLGLFFEKVNGYKDGSFFTPSPITMYMCQQAITQALIQIFNDTKAWNCKNYTELANNIEKIPIEEANRIVNSLKICDPAVGSGHFLVSSLNEIILRKFDLGILCDENGRRISKQEYDFSIVNDELIIKNSNQTSFKYNVTKGTKPNPEAQRIQKTLFNEKKNIIENCLFGVDINFKSVLICRLRLWIELLKSAYYTEESNFTQMETLPNIDINIKCGDSLISRFPFDDSMNLSIKDTAFIQDYKKAVNDYKNATDRSKKNKLIQAIQNYKLQMSNMSITKSHYAFTLDNLIAEYKEKFETERALDTEMTKAQKQDQEKEKKKLLSKIDEINNKLKALQDTSSYKNSFEWRFEFPELLDDEGNFTFFDIVIGNPPYIQLQKAYNSEIQYADLYKDQNYQTFDRTGDIYCLFYERGMQLIKENGLLAFITSNKWMRAGYGEKLRNFFTKHKPLILIDLGPNVFESATVDTNILMIQKVEQASLLVNNESQSRMIDLPFYACTLKSDINDDTNIAAYFKANKILMPKPTSNAWTISGENERKIREKIERIGTPLKDWDIKIYRGVLTGFNEAFIIDGKKKDELIASDPKSAEIIKPILRGRDIKRYKAEFADLWIIFTAPSLKINIDNYPAIRDYLKTFGKRLEQTGEKGCRKKTFNKWFELQDTIAYYEEFEKEKVVWAEMTNTNAFILEKNRFLCNQTCYFIANPPKHLIAFLNSKLIHYYFSLISASLGDGAFRWIKQYVELIPIPKISEEEQQPFIELVDKILQKKENNEDTTAEEQEIDKLVYKLYELTEEEIRIVEKGR